MVIPFLFKSCERFHVWKISFVFMYIKYGRLIHLYNGISVLFLCKNCMYITCIFVKLYNLRIKCLVLSPKGGNSKRRCRSYVKLVVDRFFGWMKSWKVDFIRPIDSLDFQSKYNRFSDSRITVLTNVSLIHDETDENSYSYHYK